MMALKVGSQLGFEKNSLQTVDASGPPCETNQDCVPYCSVPVSRGTGICFDGYCTCEKQESISNARKILHD
ncbi:hypothetical protein H5410_008296 [Solanum commersonii]|uniref:Uncharacterized protein n=1 Tax=Solanum commersonii TaxID=4109 RepID=A0A9J6AEI0_SOLCO|nr:hypothetical protein H5410_008296 [Solanum commersonii]